MHPKNTVIALMSVALPAIFAISCSVGGETAAKVKSRADAAFAAKDCTQAMLLYKKLASMDTIYIKLAQERVTACTDRMTRSAARELEKAGASLVPQPPPVQPQVAAPSPVLPNTSAKGGDSSTKVCDLSFKNRIDQVQTEIQPLEASLQGIKSKVSEIETKYKVAPSPDGGFDFSLPQDTTPDQARAFEEGTARLYANNKAEEDQLAEKVRVLKEKIGAIEAEANAAGVPRDCVYPPAKGF